MLTCLAMMENNLIDFLQARSLNNKRRVRGTGRRWDRGQLGSVHLFQGLPHARFDPIDLLVPRFVERLCGWNQESCHQSICLTSALIEPAYPKRVPENNARNSAYRLLHSVVNNSCGFNPQRKVVALIFSAARLPRLLEEICWQFAAGLPAFSSLPFFRTQTATCLQSWLHFRTPGRAPKKGFLSFFSRQCPNWGRVWGPNLGFRFGTQFWGQNLGPPSHAFLVARLRATGLQ